jgi:signal transduction histidine kinase
MPIFNEATTLAVRLIVAPVAILTAIAGASYQIGAISGVERLSALPDRPNLALELAGLEYCHDRAIDSQSCWSVTNFHNHPQLAQSALLRVHRLQSALGVPITTAAGDKLGTLAIFDFKPRQFSDREIDLLHLVSRLVASEFERKLLSQAQLNNWVGDLQYRATLGFDDSCAAVAYEERKVATSNKIEPLRLNPIETITYTSATPTVPGQIQSQLLTHLAQELRTPLTSVLGMASVLQQEVYGALTSKQKDYLGIIHHSGQQLVTLVDEISQLGGFVGDAASTESSSQQLTLQSINLELLCQLALQSLEPLSQKKQQQIKLALAANTSTTWMLDKDKVRQIVYYLSLSLIHASATDRQISIEIAQLADALQMQIVTDDFDALLLPSFTSQPLKDSLLGQDLRISLGLTLSHNLAAAHGGEIVFSPDGNGYQLTLPLLLVASPMTATDRDAIVM